MRQEQMECQERVWTQRGIELERRRRQEWERDFMVLVVSGFLFLLAVVAVVAVVVRGVEWLRERRFGGGVRQEERWLVCNWQQGRYGSELAEWE